MKTCKTFSLSLALLCLVIHQAGAAVGGIVGGTGGAGGAAGVTTIGLGANLSLLLSNAPNDSVYQLGAGTYDVTASIVQSNGCGGVNLLNKTNLTLLGVKGKTRIRSTSIGEVLWISNCLNTVIRDIEVQGRVVTNFATLPDYGTYLWGTLSYYKCSVLYIEDNFINGGSNQGIIDLGSLNGSGFSALSTNEIFIRRNTVYNTGSARLVGGGPANQHDGTAIAPTGATVEDNYLTDNFRGIEPYCESAGGANVFLNCFLRRNTVKNCIDSAITTAGSTNGHGIVAEDNQIFWDAGYSRRGTNPFPDACGILWNSGQRPVIRRNRIVRAPGNGIGYGSTLTIAGGIIEDNIIEETTNSLGNATAMAIGGGTGTGTVLDTSIRRNTILRARSEGLKLQGVRDSVCAENVLINPTSVAGEGAGLRVNSGTGVNSNVLLHANIVMDTRAAGATRLDYGIYVDAGSKAIFLLDNFVSGAGTKQIENLSGSEVSILGRPKNFGATLDFPSIGPDASFTTNITASGVTTTDHVLFSPQASATVGMTNIHFTVWGSNNVIYLRAANNNNVNSLDLPSATYRFSVRQVEAY